jgi:hypothetical protein
MDPKMPLGRLASVSVRDVWSHEANDFTPWLARAENIELLGETLDLGELEIEGTERDVGRFSADIVARDESGAFVLIENQLEATDHRHLGQILTYLAGLEGDATIVWIATKFLEEHRAAIDWLNTNTNDRFDFFGIEMEVLKIGASEAAPRFNVIAKPNDWSRGVRSTARQVGGVVLADRHRLRMAYWASFGEFLRAQESSFKIRRANKDHWFTFRIGRSGFRLNALISTHKHWIGVELYMSNDPLKTSFKALESEKAAIEAEFGESLNWQELPGKKASRIALYLAGTDPSDENQREYQHRWMLEKMEKFRNVFSLRVRNLPQGETGEAEDDEPDVASL